YGIEPFAAPTPEVSVELFTYNSVQQLVGQQIAVLHPETGLAQLELTITEVSRHKGMEHAFDAFSVHLQGPADMHCPQGVYRLSHKAFGTADLLLTPNAIDSYHICISRKKAAS